MKRGGATPEELEALIGYRFRDQELLALALTHVSAVAGARSRVKSYQRLEFLGDRVLGLAIAALLYREFPSADEGDLSKRLTELVRRESCAELAEIWRLGRSYSPRRRARRRAGGGAIAPFSAMSPKR